jgi:hypothetical protein
MADPISVAGGRMKVLLLGIGKVPHLGASFAGALNELGHEVLLLDIGEAYSRLDRWPFGWVTRRITGERPSLYRRFGGQLLAALSAFPADLILSVGACLTRELLIAAKERSRARLVMYSTDNPFNPTVSRDFVRQSLPFWDAIATPRRGTIDQLRGHCPGEVFYLPFGYDPQLHFKEDPRDDAEARRFVSDVAFLGGCDRDRVPFLNPLAEADDLDVAFYGGYYRQTAALRKRNKGFAYGRDYRLALGGTSVALCLVRRANADEHVMRTFEVPACGAFLLAERTSEHEELFEEDREAAFFSSTDEMMEKIRFYTRNPKIRKRIAEAGARRIVVGANTYRDRLQSLIARCTATEPQLRK